MLKLKELVETGTIGALRLVRGSFTYTQSRERDVRLEPEFGGGSIWDVGCYPVSLARFVVGGEPVEIFGWQTIGPTGVDVAFVGQMRFASGVFAQFDCGFCAPYRTMVEVVGSDGTLHLARSFKIDPAVPLLLTRGDRTETVAAPERMLYLGEVEDMADAILLGKPPRISLADSRANVAALAACLQSAREGRPVALG
jgi:predicted dehydrogenase